MITVALPPTDYFILNSFLFLAYVIAKKKKVQDRLKLTFIKNIVSYKATWTFYYLSDCMPLIDAHYDVVVHAAMTFSTLPLLYYV